MQDYKADIFAITETWLTQSDAVVCMENTPAWHRLLDRPRADRVRQLSAGEIFWGLIFSV